MDTNHRQPQEETLDPRDWEQLTALAHRMVDDAMHYLRSVRDRPAWQQIPDRSKMALRQPVPRAPEGAEAAYDAFVEHVLPYPIGNIHPRFWGWVNGTGTPTGALFEMLAATMNPNVAGAEQSPAYVETQVLEWFRELMGFPEGASGLLVSGGSVANLVGLTVARDRRAGGNVGEAGVHALPQPLRVYCSSETHNSIDKAMGVLGLGTSALCRVPVDDAFRIDIAALERSIAADRAGGVRPICVIGNAGTVNTGSIDDLSALRTIADREGMWFHVDGAFGALAMLPSSLRPLVSGLETADSLAFDLHKWMYMPYEAGCVFIRRVEDHRGIFSPAASYLAKDTRGIATGSDWFSDRGIQLTRGFRALKIWMSLKEHGIDKYARLIEQNVEQARYVDRLVRSSEELELLAPTALNIVCLRYRGPAGSDATPDRVDALNREILLRLQESGFAVLSPTRLRGRYSIRIAITNHRSRTSDFDAIVAEIIRLGREELAGSGVKSA